MFSLAVIYLHNYYISMMVSTFLWGYIEVQVLLTLALASMLIYNITVFEIVSSIEKARLMSLQLFLKSLVPLKKGRLMSLQVARHEPMHVTSTWVGKASNFVCNQLGSVLLVSLGYLFFSWMPRKKRGGGAVPYTPEQTRYHLLPKNMTPTELF